jgi:DNA invertase Pin-like site-specific DNA recombinase
MATRERRGIPQLTEARSRLRRRRAGSCSICLAQLAVFERSLIRERTLAGLAVARREGLIGGRRTEMVPSDVAAAEAVLANPKLRVASIARRFVVPFPTSIAASRPHG